jgi:hypothetical protein
MTDNNVAACNRDASLENFAAELTSAAYTVALRHGIRCSWIKVELAFWRAFAKTVKEWPPRGSSHGFDVRWEHFMVNLTESASHSAVKHGVNGDILEVQLDLYQAIGRVAGEALRRQISSGRRSRNAAPDSASVPGYSTASVSD